MAKAFNEFVRISEPLPFQAALSRVRRAIAHELRQQGDEPGARTEEQIARKIDDDRICLGLLSHSGSQDEARFGAAAIAQHERYLELQAKTARAQYGTGGVKDEIDRIGPKPELPAFTSDSITAAIAGQHAQKIPPAGSSR